MLGEKVEEWSELSVDCCLRREERGEAPTEQSEPDIIDWKAIGRSDQETENDERKEKKSALLQVDIPSF